VKLQRLKSPPVQLGALAIALVFILDLVPHVFPRFDVVPRIEWITYDWRMRQASRVHPPVATNLGFVFIGDDTIDMFSRGELGKDLHFGLYWPRHVYGRLINELSTQGAKAIGLDVLFAEQRPDHIPIVTTNGEIPSDLFFASALKRAGNVVLGTTREVLPDPIFRVNAAALGGISIDRDADGVLRRITAFHDVREWDTVIKGEARLSNWKLEQAIIKSNEIVFPGPHGKEHVLPLSVDGLFDRSDITGQKPAGGFSRLYPPYRELRIWHLGIVLAAVEMGVDLSKAKVDLRRGQIIFPLPDGGRRVLPVDHQGQFLLDWTLGLNDSRVTQEAFESVIGKGVQRGLGSNVPPRFEGKLVIVGSTALGNELSDRGATPLQKDTFLTSSHWNVMNSFITGKFLSPPPYWLGLLLLCAMGVFGSVTTCTLPTLRASLVVVLLAVGYIGAAMGSFVLWRYWLPLVSPLLALLAGYVALMTYQAFFEQTERQRVRELFAKIVSPKIVQELLQSKSLALTGKRRRVTVFFADIRGFTQITDRSHKRAEEQVRRENLESQQAEGVFDAESALVLKTVNHYLSIIADTVKKHDGTLDKYIGDCVMAFWGAPADNPRHAAMCVEAAIEAQRAIHRLNEEREVENRRREQENADRVVVGRSPSPLLDILSVGTGINTGAVVVGLMGSELHGQNYTVFGHEVNVASRLEKLSGSGRILIGEATFADLKKHDPSLAATCIELPPAEVRGIRDAIKIYEVPWK
jgi:class 3 adenylate cyclase/CHASE2 domain-containing sensor protein